MKKVIENLKAQVTELNRIVALRENILIDNSNEDFPTCESYNQYQSNTEEIDLQIGELVVLIEELEEINKKIEKEK